MNMELERKIKEALADIEGLRSADCLDATTLGHFAEKSLNERERQAAEEHLHICLFCLKQLNDITELLHYQKQRVPLSSHLAEQLRSLKPGQEKSAITFLQSLKGFFTFTQRQWQFSALTLATAWMVLLVSLFVMRHANNLAEIPALNANAFVQVRALNNAGGILREEQGVIVDSNGLIASNLLPLAGASRLQITLKDGRTFQTANIWKDEDKNLAVMKIDTGDLPTIPTADIEQISVGQRIFAVADPSKPGKGFQEAIISDFKEMPGRRKEGAIQYLQIATQTATITRGALVDDQGRLLGFLITEEKHINIASPATDITRIAKEGKAIPLSDLKNVNFSAEALNAHMKGILARDALRWDEAEKYFQKAVQLNPRLEGAHLELGYVYYKKLLYDKEAFEYEEALKLNPDDPEAIFSLAMNLETRGKYEEAIHKYEQTLSLDPENGEVIYNLGLAYLAQGLKDKAMALYPRLKSLDSGSAEMLRRLCR